MVYFLEIFFRNFIEKDTNNKNKFYIYFVARTRFSQIHFTFEKRKYDKST